MHFRNSVLNKQFAEESTDYDFINTDSLKTSRLRNILLSETTVAPTGANSIFPFRRNHSAECSVCLSLESFSFPSMCLFP